MFRFPVLTDLAAYVEEEEATRLLRVVEEVEGMSEEAIQALLADAGTAEAP